MATHVALLRGINVGGHKMLSMAALRETLEGAGYKDVKTLLQSGNVVFTAKKKVSEAALEKLAGTDVIVRSAAEVQSVIDANPFPAEAKKDPGHLLVMFLKEPASVKLEWPGPERIHTNGRELYLYYPNGAGRSKLTGAWIEKKLGTRGSARNWNTVGKIQALLKA